MKRVIIVGTGDNSAAVLERLVKKNNIQIAAIIDYELEAPGIEIAKAYHIPVQSSWNYKFNGQIDIIIDAAGEGKTSPPFNQQELVNSVVIPADTALELIESLDEQIQPVKNVQEVAQKLSLTFDHMAEGIIAINENEMITYVNRRAEQLTGIAASSLINHHIRKKFSDGRLPNLLQTRKKEINQRMTFENGREVICDFIPLIDKKGFLQGGVAIFRDITKVFELIEQVSDLKESEKLIETLFKISNEGISVTDEYGIVKKVNPAYTTITGFQEKEVIGRASFPLQEGKQNFHLKVLHSRKPIHETKMKIDRTKKEARINAVPLIVNGKLRGSLGIIRDVSDISMLKKELSKAKRMIRTLETNYTFEDLVKTSSEMKLAVEQSKVGADSSSAILLKGEQGTGTEIFAQAIHNQSNRRHNRFIRLNGCSVDEETVDRDWFGNSGNFASLSQEGEVKGLFEQADKGTVFIEEIGELSLRLQDKIFQMLEKKEISKDSDSTVASNDIRFIASTAANLEKSVIKGEFREYLYDRLNRLSIYVPSLRERKEDFKELIEHIIDKINIDYGKNITGMENEAIEHLKKYEWPGNLRELENVIRKAVLRMDNLENVLLSRHFSFLFSFSQHEAAIRDDLSEYTEENTLQANLDRFEERMIRKTLQSNNWNKTKSAEVLGVSIRNLYYKMKKYHITKENPEDFS